MLIYVNYRCNGKSTLEHAKIIESKKEKKSFNMFEKNFEAIGKR